MPSGSTGTFGLRRGVVRGINSDRAVLSVALQEAFVDADAPRGRARYCAAQRRRPHS